MSSTQNFYKRDVFFSISYEYFYSQANRWTNNKSTTAGFQHNQNLFQGGGGNQNIPLRLHSPIFAAFEICSLFLEKMNSSYSCRTPLFILIITSSIIIGSNAGSEDQIGKETHESASHPVDKQGTESQLPKNEHNVPATGTTPLNESSSSESHRSMFEKAKVVTLGEFVRYKMDFDWTSNFLSVFLSQ